MKRVSNRKDKQEKRRGTFLRRAPFLVAHWQGKQLFFENYLTRKKIAASMETAALLDFFSGWTRESAMFRRWPEYTEGSLRRAVRRLVEETFLQKSSKGARPDGQREEALRAWRNWNPAGGYFHFQTKDTYSEKITAEEIRFVEELLRRERVPVPAKKYPRSRTIPLSHEEHGGEFPRVLRERRTWREFGKGTVAKETLGRLLDLSFGVQAWAKIPGGGRFALKTSPSGGGLHPAEAYVAVRNVSGIPRGIYHYDAVGHRLQEIRRGASAAEIQKLLAGQWWFRRAAFVVFLTVVFGRTQWKYDYARAYRAVLAEAGHLCQTFCLTATWLGLGPFCTMALADTQIEKALRVDGISESVIYAMGAGTRIRNQKIGREEKRKAPRAKAACGAPGKKGWAA
jgi:SagB-type dehydrogenase family enzyme